jgi:hypothetical protein
MLNKDAVVSLNVQGIGAEASQDRNEDVVAQCTAEIQAVLEKYNCTIEIINDLKIVQAS